MRCRLVELGVMVNYVIWTQQLHLCLVETPAADYIHNKVCTTTQTQSFFSSTLFKWVEQQTC